MRRRLRLFGLLPYRVSNDINIKGLVHFHNNIDVRGRYEAGETNVGIGIGALQNNEGLRNVGIGYKALSKNTTGYTNVGIGSYVLENNTTGYCNVGLGALTLRYNDTGAYNVGIGFDVLRDNKGSYNVGLGSYALQFNSSGWYNIGIGHDVLKNNVSGSGNTAIGYNAGKNVTGSRGVYIGYEAGMNETQGERLYIANSGTSTPLIYGEFPNNRINLNATNINLGINTEATAGAISTYGIIEVGGVQYKIALYALS